MVPGTANAAGTTSKVEQGTAPLATPAGGEPPDLYTTGTALELTERWRVRTANATNRMEIAAVTDAFRKAMPIMARNGITRDEGLAMWDLIERRTREIVGGEP
jgi:hypothetical protein